MKLSSLINYRNNLKEMSLSDMTKTVDYSLKKVLHTVDNQDIQINHIMSSLQNQEQKIYQSIADFKSTIIDLENEIDQMINELEQPYFAASYTLYENVIGDETMADITFRTPNVPESTVNFYRNRITRYTGWQHPAMILRPGVEPYINDMVSSDPLYLVDIKHNLLEPAIKQYNEQYQMRLRPYVVDEKREEGILHRLPDDQFGVILAFNYFNFRPFEVIRKWLTEMLQKLKPGGVLLLTYNDCDREKAVILAENRFCCYTPGRLLTQLAQTLGFEIIFSWHDDGPITWLELRKPGELKTLRGGQTLAKILPK